MAECGNQSTRNRVLIPMSQRFPVFQWCRSGLLLFAVLALTNQGWSADAAATAKEILQATGIKGGLVVHVGCGDGTLTAALRANDSYQVQGLDRSLAKVTQARSNIQRLGVYGKVYADQWTGQALPYIDNLVNLLVAEEGSGLSMEEVKRVLVPNGVGYVKKGGKWEKVIKERPTTMDEWTHYYYDAKGNAVSKDTDVAPPDRLQWVGSPRWSRHHDRMSSLSAQVTAGGRMFYIMDEGSRISILLPSKWSLIARDAFNGSILWKQPIPKWQEHMWPLKSGPTQLARRLVTDGDNVYVTMAIDAPVSCLDPATGKTIRTYDATRGAEEILHVDGVLYTLVNPNAWQLTDFAPKLNTGDQKRVETEYNWDEKPRDVVAVNAATGKILWEVKQAKVAPLTLAADGKRVAFYDGDRLVCIDAVSGKQKWADTPATKRKLFEFNYGPRLLLHSDTVLYAGGDGAMKGVDANTGKELWSAPHEKSGYRSPEDLMVANGLVWNAGTLSGGQKGEFRGRDPRTGEVKVEFPPDVDTYWFHHRCYIAKGTERFLMPSRTGIEFVDINAKHWDINHWVRGACLYGVMPANGLTYAGPHNCACYPEAKLDGMNALAGGTGSPHPKPVAEDMRLVKGPAYGQPVIEKEADKNDWPTYRHDNERSGFTGQPLVQDLGQAWQVDLPGPLSALTIADGKVFVSQIDAHTVHALDSGTGKSLWQFTAGGRVDSPPTYWKGRVLFGGKDGKVYCLRASDGALVWSYLAAPSDRRHTAFEQVESVWPVHGSVLVTDGIVNLVSGRSVFLDGGLRFIRLDAATGKKQVEVVYDDKNPDTGKDLQDQLQTLQMPVGLNDILSTDGKFVYLRSQKIDPTGKRIDIGPISGNAASQGGAQKGEGAHIFAPMGFLDDSWFHRSYWVYGKNFAGGHNGYYQAGKYAPSGRILVFDEKNVYGFGRQAQYYKWTTTMEHQLFSASKEPPAVAVVPAVTGGQKKKAKAGAKGKAAPAAPVTPNVKFEDSPKLDPSNKAITMEAWIMPDGRNGIIAAHGGAIVGYALSLEEGRPAFAIRVERAETVAQSARPLDDGWHHIAGVLTADKRLLLYVDGQLAASAKASAMLNKKPAQGLQLGTSGNSRVTEFGKGAPYTGMLDQFALYYRALDEGEIISHANSAVFPKRGEKDAVILASFDNGDVRDDSGNGINGVISGVENGKGKVGAALWFRKAATSASVIAPTPGNAAQANKGSFVEHNWANTVPIITRAMAMAGNGVFISGPPDSIDEEYAFERMTQKDQAIYKELEEQDAALEGKRGAKMWLVNKETGKMQSEFELKSPPVWDGMAIAQGRLYVATVDGKVACYGKK